MDLTGYRHRDPIEPSCTSVVCDMAHLRGLSLLESMNSRQARTLAGHVDHPSAEVPGHHHRAAGEERLTDRERTPHGDARSEEHTSELQSPYDLVCRLLLE